MIIYCPDNFELLNKLRHDLIKVGYVDDEKWNKVQIKERKEFPLEYMYICENNKIILYWSNYDHINLIITPSNYSEILQILTDKIKNNESR
ncbi:hypothetical protein VF04_36695 [Nostoc linckia z7]|uniref:Uncharacterized protein n=1 Tax=Nostoc linckia z7 TaxID=1628745 RepID=A0ABX4KBA1_NOSLI|nr:hypothetical protein VF02_37830 [Nostoc linckia z1]PHJ59309.1 hypothetical protein VF05_32480 [Nostoc linckia z3]PHJ63634.1 hypothetical protein VF03_29990 [Nostoc linckia z2]PHJ70007.1 hypothetical protein VF06_37820 [Nostoc linckia z4]PHJ83472.1 hypothetical protein VF04_36695 [Nostoc linckia z7]